MFPRACIQFVEDDLYMVQTSGYGAGAETQDEKGLRGM